MLDPLLSDQETPACGFSSGESPWSEQHTELFLTCLRWNSSRVLNVSRYLHPYDYFTAVAFQLSEA
ncbi:hypothetical protein AOLI_G00200270 [Acnodon oligacanthus]